MEVVAIKRDIWTALFGLLPHSLHPDKSQKMAGWIDG